MANQGGMNGDGTIFQFIPGVSETIETVLYNFQGGPTDGAYPSGRLLQESDGNFYGTTANGGGNNYGNVFKVTPKGTETILYSFQGGTSDGANPRAGLVQASDGNLYGMTDRGGTNDTGVVFEITAGDTESVVHFFKGPDGAEPVGRLIQASDGNFYAMTQLGGVNNYGAVFEISSGNTFSLLHSFLGGTTDGANPSGGLIEASDGNFYGTTSLGGEFHQGIFFKITPGGTETVLYNFPGGTSNGSYPTGSLIQGSDGDFYGVTSSGGTDNIGTIFKITPGGAESLLYSFKGGTLDGANPSGGLLEANDGNLYGMTVLAGLNGDGTIFEFN